MESLNFDEVNASLVSAEVMLFGVGSVDPGAITVLGVSMTGLVVFTKPAVVDSFGAV